ncbi:MAG: hypothetical protein RIR70_380 [Pseudomonadota bacterium]
MLIPQRWVVDTNVVLDLFHFKRSGLEPLLSAIESGEARCYTCPRTLEELRHVIAREHFKLAADAAQALFAQYEATSIIALDPPGYSQLPRCKDTADQKFLELAFSVSADLLITRDKALLKLGKRVGKLCRLKILTPEKALAI